VCTILERIDKVMDKPRDDVPVNELVERLHSRGDFLKMAGAAGLGAAIGANVLLREAYAVNPTGPTDPSFSFSIKANYSAFDVISDNFVEHRDGFDRNQNLYEVLTPAPELSRGGVSLNNGRLRVSGDSPFFTLFRTSKAPSAPYAAVIVDVRAFSRSAAGQNTVYAGLIKDASNYVVAWYNHATQKAGFDVAVNGTVTKLAETSAPLAAPMRFAFVLNSKEITALADTGAGAFDGWKPVANYPNWDSDPDPDIAPGLSQYVDLRDKTVLAEYKYGFGVRGGSGATIVLDSVEAGYWGRAGVRDNHVVTYADGTPYIKDNKLYLTLTNAGLDFFSTAHWGLYTLDLSDYTSPTALKEVGKLFWNREGKVMGDHAGHIVYDDTNREFIIGVSTWGDFTYQGVEIYHTSVQVGLNQDIEVLHGVHVLTGQELTLPTALPTPPTGNWDPHFTRIGQEWYVAFVESPTQGTPWDHHPALAKGPTIENLTLVDAKEELKQTEGMVIQKVGGEWYVLCSTGRGDLTFEGVPPGSFRIYDLEMNLVAYRNDTTTPKWPYPTNIPHPMITPLPNRPGPGDTKWIMLTFNETFFYIDADLDDPADHVGLGYGTHGNFVVMDGPTWEGYYEFPPR
jgi:hypothetical protein